MRAQSAKHCDDCVHVILQDAGFTLCRRTAFKHHDTGELCYVPVMMERQKWAECCGPDAKFFEPKSLKVNPVSNQPLAMKEDR